MSIITAGIASRLKGDRYIWLIVVLLSLFSLLLIYSSTEMLAYKKRGGDTEFYLIKQIIMLGTGLIVMYLCHMVNYMVFRKIAMIGMGFSVLLLLYTLLFGSSINAANRWISLPFIELTFQTSDLGKLALILYVAFALANVQDVKLVGEEATLSFWRIFGPVLIVCGLIAPANLSTAGILFATCIAMMFIGRLDMKFFGYMLLLAVGGFAILILLADSFPHYIRVSTWESRISNFLHSTNPDVVFQVEQAKIAIAKGGLFGVGPGNGTQSNFLPSAYSDYIYCIIIEEFGLVGGLTVIGLYLGLLVRCVRMVTLSPKAFGSLLALGLCINLVIQAFANMMVSVNLIPVTGLTMPFISLGGTSLLFTCVSLGVILSVSRYSETSNQNQI